MCTTVRATSAAAITGSTANSPLAWRIPLRIRSVISVAALPMSIWPQAIRYGRPSSDSDFVSPVTACLVAVYAIECGRGAWAEIEPLLMMRPPCGSCSFICRYAACAHRKAPVRFTSTTARQSAAARSSSGTPPGPNVPALLNSRSSRPNRSRTAAKSASTSSASVTSVVTHSASVSPAPAAVSASGSARRPASASDQPAPARARATARPIPDPAPVTTATFRPAPSTRSFRPARSACSVCSLFMARQRTGQVGASGTRCSSTRHADVVHATTVRRRARLP